MKVTIAAFLFVTVVLALPHPKEVFEGMYFTISITNTIEFRPFATITSNERVFLMILLTPLRISEDQVQTTAV